MTHPTVVLVHGAFADSSSWGGVIRELTARGIPSLALVNPLRGVAHDGDYVAHATSQIEGDVVLVGHSYGGAVITHAGVRTANARALVFVAAFAPDEGQAVGALIEPYPPTLLAAALVPRSYPVGDGFASEVYIDVAKFPQVFAADVDPAQTAVSALTQRPIAAGAFAEPLSGAPAWRSLPNWYLVATADRAIDPGSQRVMAAAMDATTIEVDASHAVAVSNPVRVAGLIADAVAAVAAG